MNLNDPLQFTLLNQWQRGFPICREPFDILARSLRVGTAEVIGAYSRLRDGGALSRIGGVFGAGAGGASVLAAMAVPAGRLSEVASQVSAHPGVNHNYERENRLNLWFVMTGRSKHEVEHGLCDLEDTIGITILRLPMVQPYGVDLAFDLRGHGAVRGSRAWAADVAPVQARDVPLAALLEQGVPLVRRPFDLWARALSRHADDVIDTVLRWLEAGTLSRFGVVVRHHELGYTANAMTVFDVPDDRVDACGQALAREPGITLAYRRARAHGWPYNLYCMVHGTDQMAVRQVLAEAIDGAGLMRRPHEVLFSLRRFKQTGAQRFSLGLTADSYEEAHAAA